MTEQTPPTRPPLGNPFAEMSARRLFDLVKTPITLLALIALVAFGGWWGMGMATKPAPKPAPVPCVQTKLDGPLKSQQVAIRVFNGGTKRGLARTVSNTMKSAGFVIDDIDNTKERVTVAEIRGSNVEDPEMKLVAGFFPGAKLKGDNRPDHVVDIFVGNKFEDIKEDAPKEIAVPSGVACLAKLTPVTPNPEDQPTQK